MSDSSAAREYKLVEVTTVTDEYTLTVRAMPFAADEEREPNEADNDATRISAGRAMRGTFARWRDVDKWRFDGDPGSYSVEVTGGDALPVSLRLGNGASAKTRKLDGVALAAGEIITVERADPDAAPAQRKPLAGADVEYTLTIRKK